MRGAERKLTLQELMNTTKFTTQMKGTWVMVDGVVTYVTVKYPPFLFAAFTEGKKRGRGINR